jgi:hypothetical protein
MTAAETSAVLLSIQLLFYGFRTVRTQKEQEKMLKTVLPTIQTLDKSSMAEGKVRLLW